MRERMARQARELGGLWRHNTEWWWRRRLRIADWVYALGLAPFVLFLQVMPQMGLVQGMLDSLPQRHMAAVALAIVLFLGLVPTGMFCVTVLLRRSRPMWLLGLASVLLLAFGDLVPAAFALYSYAVHFDDRRLLAGWFALMTLAMSIGVDVSGIALFVNVAIFLVVPTTFGLWVGTRRQLVDRLHERAERLEREQHLMAEQAIGAERTRIAREMHDVVAHRVSLMVLHAGGLEVSAPDERTAEAAGVIRTTGREALAELRGILGVLRDDTGAAAPTAPQPVLADLDRLVEDWRGAGMTVVRTGEDVVPDLPAHVQRTAFRVVQEGLTNAAKHAPGARVSVDVRTVPDGLAVEVANGPATVTSAPPPVSGFGLTGLHERVTLAGGALTSGRRFDGGWRLRAIVPIDHHTGTERGPR
ncbi:sensor histidine kinase [Nocardiopsis sp. NRRL B-16309]|uniref:sensor histidine kinase n=1 Tax=Nocardiopsis sp. NRRL B-16309 TaxID=1519494 RepID=UPI0006AF5C76|nr:histidine kinase [Nocardiopsis sp. NRRL B-16309]KOX10049.1 histidine kinase [Nocardiopsis sp. NRRL B-16309]